MAVAAVCMEDDFPILDEDDHFPIIEDDEDLDFFSFFLEEELLLFPFFKARPPGSKDTTNSTEARDSRTTATIANVAFMV